MKSRVGLYLLLVCLIAGFLACRRNQPSLVDANRAPDTELWYAPPDSTEYEYLVHLYWRGLDIDGVAEKFIWTITDTIVANPELRWNPANRLQDFRMGRITTRTDSMFSFTAFREVDGVGIKKSRQAFHVAAIDDNGAIDPTPVAVEFVATIDKLPETKFDVWLRKAMIEEPSGNYIVEDILKPYDPAVLDTVGMFRPFSIRYSGITTNGLIRAFKFFPLTAGVVMDGQNEWTEIPSDPSLPKDSIRFFVNGADTTGMQAEDYWHFGRLESGPFRMAAVTRDEAGAESRVDATTFTRGVCEVVVNFDPETEITFIRNLYWKNDVAEEDTVNISDALPDTVPYQSWIQVHYWGWDSPYDSSLCVDATNKCITYQMSFERESDRFPWATSRTQWMPSDPVDTNPDGLADSMSMNMGTVEYTVLARAVDEYGQPDGTPAAAPIVANFAPTLDSHALKNYDNQVVDDGDTLIWDWWRPTNTDTLVLDPLDPHRKKVFYWVVEATGHDHPKDPDGSAVTTWYYLFQRAEDPLFLQKFARSRVWVPGPTVNALSDTFRHTFKYPLIDFDGDTVFENLPEWLDRSYDLSLKGKDLPEGSKFDQYVYHSGGPKLINSYGVFTLGRWTEEVKKRFYFTMRR